MNTIVIHVSELLDVVSRMSENNMEYALLDIEREANSKRLYVSGVESSTSQHDIEFGCLEGVAEMEDD